MNDKNNLPPAWKIFNDEYKNSVNFITPEVIKKDWLIKGVPGLVYELSTGEGIFGTDPLYGVTIVKYNSDLSTERSKLSQCCHSLEEAESYIDKIKREGKIV